MAVHPGWPIVLVGVLLGAAPAVPASSEEAAFEVLDFRARLAESNATLFEHPDYLSVRSPLFVANATVQCDVPEGEAWTVGFIQQLDSNEWKNEYDHATTSWEFPSLPISDARSRTAPWYGEGAGEVAAFTRKATGQVVELAMRDEPSAQATWREPLPPLGKELRPDSMLRGLRRWQCYTLWLAARRESDLRVKVLRKAVWRWEAVVEVHPERPLGSRASARPRPAVQPVVSSGSGEEIPPGCLVAPIANDAQEFWWAPKNRESGMRTRLRIGR